MFETRNPETNERERLLNLEEDQFCDFKCSLIAPEKLQKTFVAFANADGGDLYVGIKDKKKYQKNERISGFKSKEDADGHITTLLEQTKPTIEGVNVEFIDFNQGSQSNDGFVLHFIIPKSSKVHYTAKDECYQRVNTENRLIKGDRLSQLNYTKGAYSFETKPINNISIDDITESSYLDDYMFRVETKIDKKKFLKKQGLISPENGTPYPNAACVLMFDEIPEATLRSKCAIKIIRLRTAGDEYRREQLQPSDSFTISSPIEKQINDALEKINNILEKVIYERSSEKLQYPINAIKEIVVNAVIHRDYSIKEDIFITIYDNRIEIKSPGKFPGYITKDNIYEERYSRNSNIVRLLHNLPNPLNHDIGEGLNTVKNELKKVGLVDPKIEESENSVIVTIKHEKIATLEQIIKEFFSENPNATIANRDVRRLSGENDMQKVKSVLKKLRLKGDIELVDKNTTTFHYKYKLVKKE